MIRPPRSSIAALILVLIGWSLFAFAGSYWWTSVPTIAGAAAAVLAAPPRFGRPHRLLDLSLALCLLATAAQLVPLPSEYRYALSPGAPALERALFLDPAAGPLAGPSRPLSMDPASTRWSLLLGGAIVALFWSARAAFEERGGIRRVSRGIAGLGLVLACVVFVQRAVSPRLFYGWWSPLDLTPDPRPLGPFINRNMLATWLMLAIPTVVGYLLARLNARRAGGVQDAIDARTLWLSAALCLMLATLLASLSRSGLAGVATAFFLLILLARQRLPRAQVAALAAGMVSLAVLAALYANVPALAARVGDVFASGLGGRLEVWRQTGPMAVDFPLTGLGVGAFERGMSVYQTSTRTLFLNHAHNEYLQVVVEGGLLLAMPVGMAAAAAAWGVMRRLQADRTSVFWIRAGAAAGLLAVAAQSVWDVGLRQPANATLFAAVAAIALHAPRQREG